MTRLWKKIALGVLLVHACLGLAGCGNKQSSAQLLAEAKQYHLKGNDKAALIQLKNAAVQSPEDAEVRFQLASLYIGLSDGASAEKEIRRAIAAGGSRVRAAPDLARALLMQAKPQAAIDETSAQLGQGSASLHAAHGDAYLDLGDKAKAVVSYQQALSADGGFTVALIGLARVAVMDKDPERARSLTERAIAANPKDPIPWIYMGYLLRSEDRLDDAIAAFGKAIALQPTAVGPYLERANDEIRKKNFSAAKADFDAARKLAPGTPQVTYIQARLEASQGRLKPAREAVQKVLSAVPSHLPSVLLAGMLELRLGNMSAAEQHLRKYVESFPKSVYARTLLAKAMLGNARPAEAEAILEPLLKDGRQDPELYALIGESSMQRKQFDIAAANFAKASALAPDSAAFRTSLALSKLDGGDSIEAVAQLETATKLDPASLKAGIALIQTELKLAHFDRAMAAVVKLERAHPNNAEVLNVKGGTYLAQGDLPNARASFAKAIALQPDYFVPVMNLTGMDKREGRLDAAKKHFEAFLALNKQHFGAMWGLADIAAVQGHKEQASAWLEKARAENPTMLAPALKLSYHYLATKRAPKALALLQQMKTSYPANPPLLDLLGQVQMENKDFAGALDTFNKLAAIHPKLASPHMRLAAAHLATKNDAAAAQDLKRAVAAQPDFLPARIGQIEVVTGMGRWDEALGLVHELQKRDGNASLGFVLEGDLQMLQKRPALALPPYEKAFSLGKSPELLIKLVDAMKLAGKTREAESALVRWCQANPGDAMIPLYLSQHYAGEKQFAQAAEALRAVLQLKPDNAVALNNLAWTYHQGKDPRALETAERAVKLAPGSPVAMDTLGWLLVEQGNHARALSLLQSAASKAPAAKDIRYHLAVALYKSGDKPGARKELERVLLDKNGFAQAADAAALLKSL
jgi:putative PEP-CTERM system TPR-repeat lipoprotein